MSDSDLFGAVRMGYVIVESGRLDDWRRFLKQGLGLHEAQADDAALAFRIDGHARRFIVRRGSAEDIVATGWQLRDPQALAVILQRLADRGIEVETGSAEEAAFRGVTSFVRIRGPKGMPVELFTEAVTTDTPLNMLASGFVTGDSGMGHLAITSRQPEKMQRFWQEIFDARLSDRIAQPMAGMMLDITFLRLNERHHSIAIAATRGLRLDPIRTTIQHVNMLVSSLDDLSAAFERLTDLCYEMAHEIGQHPNDREVSFYVVTPSGFELELGWNALTVDEEGWQTASYNAISIWGHKPANNNARHKLGMNLGNLCRGLRSMLKPEYSPL
jgi:2,3-dihydroxybiphenyl 1,2-dioxygenase